MDNVRHASLYQTVEMWIWIFYVGLFLFSSHTDDHDLSQLCFCKHLTSPVFNMFFLIVTLPFPIILPIPNTLPYFKCPGIFFLESLNLNLCASVLMTGTRCFYK